MSRLGRFCQDLAIDDYGVLHVSGQAPPYNSLDQGLSFGQVRPSNEQMASQTLPAALYLRVSRSGSVLDVSLRQELQIINSLSV